MLLIKISGTCGKAGRQEQNGIRLDNGSRIMTALAALAFTKIELSY